MALTSRQVETAKPKEKDYKLSNERGLFLLIKTSGARYWRMKSRISDKEKKLSIGVYPEVTLAEARLKRDEAQKVIAEGAIPVRKSNSKNSHGKSPSSTRLKRLLWRGIRTKRRHGPKAIRRALWKRWEGYISSRG